MTSLLFGLIPVLRFRAFNVAVLKEAGRSTSDAPGRHRTRNTLVVAQVALALVLLIVSGLMARTFVAMRQVQPGFVRPAEVQTFRIALPPTLIPDRQQVAQTYEQIAERLKQVPGVVAVGLANMIPTDGERYRRGADLGRGPACFRNASLFPGQGHRTRVFRNDRQPSGGRTRDHVDRYLSIAASRRHLGESGPRVLGRTIEGARQAHRGPHGVVRGRGRLRERP